MQTPGFSHGVCTERRLYATGRLLTHTSSFAGADRSPLAPVETRCVSQASLREFLAVSIVLCLHVGEKLDELGRLADAIQEMVAGIARIQVVTRNG